LQQIYKIKNKKEIKKMKQVKPSKIMIERCETVVKAISGENEFTQDNASALAWVLELPSVNKVNGDEYGLMLRDIITAIVMGDCVDVLHIEDRIDDIVTKTKRELSPKVRQERYEKAVAKLQERYGVKGE
jgi:hypothetical protein